MKQPFQDQLQQEEESAIDLTPMLDVVFIMLIFFIVTASFIKEAGIEVNRPEAQTESKKDNASIIIAINANGEVWLDRRRVDIRSVRANVERLHAENPQGAVVIQPDRSVETDILIKVVDAVREAGVYDSIVSTDDD